MQHLLAIVQLLHTTIYCNLLLLHHILFFPCPFFHFLFIVYLVYDFIINIYTTCFSAILNACFLSRQAQLSQRDRATLRVIEYFAKSLNVTQDHLK